MGTAIGLTRNMKITQIRKWKGLPTGEDSCCIFTAEYLIPEWNPDAPGESTWYGKAEQYTQLDNTTSYS